MNIVEHLGAKEPDISFRGDFRDKMTVNVGLRFIIWPETCFEITANCLFLCSIFAGCVIGQCLPQSLPYELTLHVSVVFAALYCPKQQ